MPRLVSYRFAVTSLDLVTFAMVAVVFTVNSAIAIAGRGLAATRVCPAIALRGK